VAGAIVVAAVAAAAVVTAAEETALMGETMVAVAVSVAGVLAVEVWVVATPRQLFSWLWQSETAKVA
jgi:hypothetical protein